MPKNNYQVTVNHGKQDGGPVFSDRTRMAVVFPELQSGDSIVLTLRRTESEPMFAGEFSIADFFYDQTAYDNVTVSISLPNAMQPQVQVRGMQKKVTNAPRAHHYRVELQQSGAEKIRTRKCSRPWENGKARAVFCECPRFQKAMQRLPEAYARPRAAQSATHL